MCDDVLSIHSIQYLDDFVVFQHAQRGDGCSKRGFTIFVMEVDLFF